jgi:predicted dithiol-disulfide oxidoreductase (DUF899 family)
MDIAFPGESAEYRAARNRLLEQEIELRRATEAVAAARRGLPPGGIVPQDYVFHGRGPDGGVAEVRLSELFAPGRNSLVIYSMMFPRAPGDDRPGPASGQTALRQEVADDQLPHAGKGSRCLPGNAAASTATG